MKFLEYMNVDREEEEGFVSRFIGKYLEVKEIGVGCWWEGFFWELEGIWGSR